MLRGYGWGWLVVLGILEAIIGIVMLAWPDVDRVRDPAADRHLLDHRRDPADRPGVPAEEGAGTACRPPGRRARHRLLGGASSEVSRGSRRGARARRGSRGGRCAARRERRSRTVRPRRCATPNSVTTRSSWWRGVVTSMPSGSAAHDAGDDARRRPSAVDGRQSSDRSSSSSPDTDTKSSWPPMPGELPAADACRPTTWPQRSTASAPLIVTISSVARRSISGEFDDVDRQEAHVVVAVEPLVELGGAGGERRDREARRTGPCARLVTLPAWCSCISPVVNISECTP